MKGFGIYIKNDLLDANHIEKMGVSVWLYMWLIDKMTSISEEGIGKVSGGKPITFEDIKSELGISPRTYSRWVDQLEKFGYINSVRTPHGLVITVNKAVKIFGNKSDQNSDMPQMADHKKSSAINDKRYATNGRSKRYATNGRSNIRQYSLDNTIDNTSNLATDVAEGKRFNELLDKFKTINPNHEKFFSNKTERRALQELVDKYGFSKIDGLLTALPDIVQKPYAPRITSPYTLQKKLAELSIFLKQEKAKGVSYGQQPRTIRTI